MRKPYRIYRQILRLYPRSFHAHYGQEMVQVLDDLLAEETSTLGRIIVWLRVGSELPVSIIQENIHTIEGKATHKPVLGNSRRPIIIITASLAAVMLLTSSEWLRIHVLPDAAGVFFHRNIVRTFDAQSQAIGDPMSLAGASPPATYSCDVLAMQGASTEIGCQASSELYIQLASAGSKSSVMDKVTAVEADLKQAGYKPGGNGVTLTSLVGGTYEGKDYSPDAFYQKIAGKYHCILDTQVAYSNPAPPAIHMQQRCTRTINILGTPSTATYQSTTGFNH
jgi:hypothetical protein